MPGFFFRNHYNDVIMGAIASQITSLTIVYPIVCSTQIKENIKAPRHWPLCGEFAGDGWIPRTNCHLRGKCFHLITSSWWQRPSTTWGESSSDILVNTGSGDGLAPSHYQNSWSWLTGNQTHMKKVQWNLNQNKIFSFKTMQMSYPKRPHRADGCWLPVG